ncbi:MAG: hypothetical protein JXR59_07775 [Desulfuromonadaceae bacterium]|nr:hypothetical protein [Desulfuromonadaceae bacterium]
MEHLSAQQFQHLLASSRLVEEDGYGPKVLRTPSGQIVKIFRRKRLLSSALFLSYARRFARNARRLYRLGVPTITVRRLASCREPKRQLVWYDPLPGTTLRDWCREHPPESLMPELGAFVAQLHERGVLFRSLHWGNIIVSAQGTLGLIDIADIRFYRRPLTLSQRQRNFQHLLRYAEDCRLFHRFAEGFWAGYLAHSRLAPQDGRTLQAAVTSCQGQH